MIRIIFAGLVGLAASGAMAQTGKSPWEEYGNRIEASRKVSPLGNNAFGDQISLSNGALSFAATDVSIPGNSGLSVAFSRSYSVKDWRHRVADSMMFDWDVDVPSISAVHATQWLASDGSANRCSVGGPPQSPKPSVHASDYWQGESLNIPGVTGGELLRTKPGSPIPGSGGPYYWMTNEHVHVSCLPTIKNGTGQGYLAITPDGTRYWFDWMAQYHEPELLRGAGLLTTPTLQDVTPRRRNVLYATRVEDRFGNVVTYTYTNSATTRGKLTQISGNDGRQITVNYSSIGGQQVISSVSDGTRSWAYTYGTTTSGRRTLTQVTLPDASKWSINFAAFTNAEIMYSEVFQPGEIYRTCTANEIPLNYNAEPVGTITHPAGVVGTFKTFIFQHGRSNVPLHCSGVTTWVGHPPGTGNDTNNDAAIFPFAYDAFTLKSKTVSGPGLTAAQWDYAYTSGRSVHRYPGTTFRYPVCVIGHVECRTPPCVSEACAGFSTTVVTGPGGEWKRYTHGNSFGYNEGKLTKVEEGTGPSNILQTVAHTYDLSRVDQAYKASWGWGSRGTDSFPNEFHRPLLSTTTTVQGINFSRNVTQFDPFARPVAELEASSLGSRTSSTEHHDVTTATWVLGQVKRRVVEGIQTERTEFDGNNLPWKLRGPGDLLVQTLTFYADGTIATAKDAKNQTTTLSNWYRGVPRNVQFADSNTQSATVTPLGWVTGVTDENGFTTNYAYDAMGRVSQVTYPAGDSVAWAPTTISTVQVAAAEYGIPAGHWRQVVSTGNGRRETYFDAMWRPRLVREYDAGNVAATSRFTVQDYDHEGRSAFSAYPVASLSSVAGANQGVWTTYDALGRVTAVSQDSEQGLLTTTTEYLPGFQTRTTNPRGHATTVSFQAFSRPDTSSPTLIQAPAGITTAIARTALGEPTSITRTGTWAGLNQSLARQYFYDTQRRLCKTVEPETGATLMGYDAVGNLSWSAAGLPTGQACEANGTSAPVLARRATRQYDARNRLITLAFPDSNGNQAWTYTPDGLPATITTLNNGGTTSVVNTYSYNKRRMMTAETAGIPGWYTWNLGYGYNANGHLASQSYPTGLSVAYAPNALGQATQAGTYATGVQYHPSGAIKQFTYGNGLVHTMVQNARRLPARSTDTGGALDHEYGYDQNGNVLATIDHNDSTRTAGWPMTPWTA